MSSVKVNERSAGQTNNHQSFTPLCSHGSTMEDPCTSFGTAPSEFISGLAVKVNVFFTRFTLHSGLSLLICDEVSFMERLLGTFYLC